MCIFIPSLVKALILMWLHIRKFQKLIQEKGDLTFDHIFSKQLTAWWCKTGTYTSKKQKWLSKGSRKHGTTAAPALVNLCWWIATPCTLHLTQTKTMRKLLPLLLLPYKGSLNDPSSLDLDTIIWCLGENCLSLVASCAWTFYNRAMS